jgi:gliding motility associated protien GldN
MRTLVKLFGTTFLLFFGWEFSNAQANNTNTNQPVVSQPQPNSNSQQTSSQPSVLSPQPLDGAYNSDDRKTRKVILPAEMRMADIMWQTRIWRVIDTREKINQQLYYPLAANGNRISLFEVLKDALSQGEITAYDFNPVDMDDCDKLRLTKTEIQEKLSSIDTIQDENGNMVPVKNETDPSKIRGYTIKEDWHFEKQRSVLDPRILFISPRIQTINKNTGKEDENAAPTSLFWIYFPDIRPLLAKTQVFNAKNDAEWRTFDDIFWKRQFSSYIVQQSNVFDRQISAYLKGLDALLEGEKMHNSIAEIESNMWSY